MQAQLQVGSTILEEREVVDGLDVPWEIKWGPDDFLWITERDGIVSRINVETGEKHVILDIQDEVWQSSESGLLGMEIHPDFNNGSPYVFLAYTYLSGGQKEKCELMFRNVVKICNIPSWMTIDHTVLPLS